MMAVGVTINRIRGKSWALVWDNQMDIKDDEDSICFSFPLNVVVLLLIAQGGPS
jgi:hypothetical protein